MYMQIQRLIRSDWTPSNRGFRSPTRTQMDGCFNSIPDGNCSVDEPGWGRSNVACSLVDEELNSSQDKPSTDGTMPASN